MYKDIYRDDFAKKLAKLRKKDIQSYLAILKKIEQILANPHHEFKTLRYELCGVSRVHIGHFVLTFIIDHNKKTVSFVDYDHHDSIYK